MDVAEGFDLWEDEDSVYLTRHGETVATFSTAGATKQSVQEETLRQQVSSKKRNISDGGLDHLYYFNTSLNPVCKGWR